MGVTNNMARIHKGFEARNGYTIVPDSDGVVEYAPDIRIRGEDSGQSYYGNGGSRKWVGPSWEYYTTHRPNIQSRSHQKRHEEESRGRRADRRAKQRRNDREWLDAMKEDS